MSFWRKAVIAIAVFFCAISFSAGVDLPQTGSNDAWRYPPIPAANAVRTFQIRYPFHLQLVAAEPLVVSPVAMSFDEDGRLFVAEMRDYPERGASNAPTGAIRMLTDTNADGVFDTSTFYVKELPLPSAVICCNGGVFVAATPDILFFKDSDGDGVADIRDVIFTGFGEAVPKLDADSLVNSFTWGLDNRIHGVTAMNGGNVTPMKSRQPGPIPLRGKDFSFDPRAFTLEVESGSAQFGMSFDSRGRKFVCDSSHHAKLVMYEARYAARNAFCALPLPIIDIAPAATPIYRISPATASTRLGVQSPLSSFLTTRFSRASGVTIYRGNAFPIEYQETEFVCDASANLVHHDKLREKGLELTAERNGDPRAEFLASRDTWFRPVALANAPDGALYVADMYREIIEPVWRLPSTNKRNLLNGGNDRGRIYRIIPLNFKQPLPFRLSKVATTNLVAVLASPNGWHRDTAARLLYQRQDKTAVPVLARLALASPAPFARLHALCALDGLNALTEAHIVQGLSDRDERVREQAVRLSEKLIPANGPMRDSVWNKLVTLRSDPSPRVRYQLAFTAGEARHRGKVFLLSEILRRDLQDKWVPAAALSSLNEGSLQMLQTAVGDRGFNANVNGREFLNQLAQMIGARNDTNEVMQTVAILSKVNDQELSFALFNSLGDGLRNAKSSLVNFDFRGDLLPIYDSAFFTIEGYYGTTNSVRMQAIRLLSQGNFRDFGHYLFNLLAADEPEGVKIAALRGLARFTEPEVSAGILQDWNAMTARVRSEALMILMSRRDGMAALLAGIQSGVLRAAELNQQQILILTSHPDARIRDEALKIFGKPTIPRKEDLIPQFQPALKLGGNIENGRRIFRARCASCHKLGGEGHAVGPDLANMRAVGKERILLKMLDPNRDVAPNYIAYAVDTKDGETVAGLIVNEAPQSISIRQANGSERVIPSSNIEKIQTAGLSMMPEGLETGLKPQEMANLLEFVISVK